VKGGKSLAGGKNMKQIYKAIIAALVLIAIAATVFTNAHAGEDRPVLGGWTEEEKTITEEQKEIFDRENPYWKDFFSDRQ
jgi:uncharacterized protein YxeA